MQAKSLHIGIDYCGLRGCALDSPVLDATLFAELAEDVGYQPLRPKGTLLNGAATRTAVANAITDAAVLKSGDHLLVTFGGYGASVNVSSTRPADLRAWRLRDERLPLSVLFKGLSLLAEGVRVAVISGCCFSGPSRTDLERSRRVLGQWPEQVAGIAVTSDFFTESQLAWIAAKRAGKAGASVVHFASCGVDETISDGTKGINTVFALTLRDALKTHRCRAFADLKAQMEKLAPTAPKPQIEPVGPTIQAFNDAGPFCPK
jgi:hypothetical protein